MALKGTLMFNSFLASYVSTECAIIIERPNQSLHSGEDDAESL